MKSVVKEKQRRRMQRKRRVRSKIVGTSTCPRLTVYRSNCHFYAQAIDDGKQHTIAAVSSLSKGHKNSALCEKLGTEMGKKLKQKKITAVVFDRNGFLYHGIVATFANAVRATGITF